MINASAKPNYIGPCAVIGIVHGVLDVTVLKSEERLSNLKTNSASPNPTTSTTNTASSSGTSNASALFGNTTNSGINTMITLSPYYHSSLLTQFASFLTIGSIMDIYLPSTITSKQIIPSGLFYGAIFGSAAAGTTFLANHIYNNTPQEYRHYDIPCIVYGELLLMTGVGMMMNLINNNS